MANQNKFVNGTPEWVKSSIINASQKYNVPTAILSSLLKQESGFNPNAKSKAGALGIAQFMPDTAKGYGINPLDPYQSIDAAGKYLRNSLDSFNNNMSLALASYNAGGGNVRKYGGIPPFAETQNYVRNVLSMAGEPTSSAPNVPTAFTGLETSSPMGRLPSVPSVSPVPTPTSQPATPKSDSLSSL